jgi:stage V sporulation protein SpoVS
MSDFIKVSRHDAVNRVGGKIAWNARRGESHPIIASGAAAIYKAMAAIAAARRFLEKDDLELVCQPAFRAENKAASLAIYFSTVKQRYRGVLDSKTIISVNKTSQPQAVAGAISARIRENLNPLITAIGEEAVCNAVMAMSRTRIYLEEDRLDIRFVAIEEEMELKGGDGQVREMNAMRFRLYGEQVEADTSGGGDD